MIEMSRTFFRDPQATIETLQQTARNAHRRFLKPAELVQAQKTPFELIYQEDIVRLRYYPPLNDSHIVVDGKTIEVCQTRKKVPLVIVAPLAVNMYIYDLFPERSLVKYLLSQGFELYLIDWGAPSPKHNHYKLESYFAQWMPKLLSEVRKHSGSQKLSLHGWSLGGLFSLCYAALGDPDIQNIALVGAPCDYHAEGPMSKQYKLAGQQIRWLEQKIGFRIHDTRKRWYRSPGWANSLAFKLTNPVASMQGYMELLRNLHREDYVISHATNAAFLDDMVAYPGAAMQDIMQYLWADNALAQGKLPMRSPSGELARVKANMLLVCGKNDPIVSRACSTAMLRHVSSEDQTVIDVPGGHMGILGGSKAPSQIWPHVAQWLSTRSD